MVIGITGGVGCGKSTILEILATGYGAGIILADDVARELQEPGMPVFDRIIEEFGKEILSEDGSIDRKKLADIVFADEKKLELLNSLVHPAVKQEIIRRIRNFQMDDPDRPVVVEAALLIEAGYRDILDEIWAVIVDYEERVERLRVSRGYSREKTDSIMENQMSNEDFIRLTDFYIDNSKDLENTKKTIDGKMKELGIKPVKQHERISNN